MVVKIDRFFDGIINNFILFISTNGIIALNTSLFPRFSSENTSGRG